MGWGYYEYREYVPVAKRKASGLKSAAALAKKQGREPSPVKLEGRKIAKTFWGQSWCDNLESYSDYANRLPRGATYVRNGSVVDLVIKPRRIEAIVAGSEAYTISIDIAALPIAMWKLIKQDCTTAIDSLLDLLAETAQILRWSHETADSTEWGIVSKAIKRSKCKSAVAPLALFILLQASGSRDVRSGEPSDWTNNRICCSSCERSTPRNLFRRPLPRGAWSTNSVPFKRHSPIRIWERSSALRWKRHSTSRNPARVQQ